MQTIGLTGGIASGKSTVSHMIRAKGARVIDADAIAKRLSVPGGSIHRAFVRHFPFSFFLPDGTMDRRRIGRFVFDRPKEKAWIDATCHPLIQAEAQSEMHEALRRKERVVVFDVPLLYEVGWDRLVDEVWLVYVPPAVQLARLMAREGNEEEEARARIAAQMPLDEKRVRADVILDNSGTPDELAAQFEAIWEERVHGQLP